MRMRRKPWARPELAACEFFAATPYDNIGRWHKCFKENYPIHMELGCGKGLFIANLASKHPDINYIAIDIKSEMLGIAKRNVERGGGWDVRAGRKCQCRVGKKTTRPRPALQDSENGRDRLIYTVHAVDRFSC